jgi:adenosine kinase
VPECLLIEPTETESKETLDAFVDAMAQILEEARNEPDKVRGAPYTTPVRRLDDVRAARQLDVAWKPARRMSALICGSIAYDNIMVFQGRFQDQILPDQIHVLNVSFLVPALRREFGGCAANIAYNLACWATRATRWPPWATTLRPIGTGCGAKGVPLDTCASCPRFLDRGGLHHHRSRRQPDHGLSPRRHGARAPEQGAGRRRHRWGMVSPDGRQAMIDHGEQFAAAGIPFVFDPGQGLPMFGPRN